MPNTNISISTDSELTEKAQSVLAGLGLDMSTAVNVFLAQIVLRRGIPFEITEPPKKHAKLGGWEGKIHMSDDFDGPMEEFKDYM